MLSSLSSNDTGRATLALLLNASVWGLSWIGFRSMQADGLHPLLATALAYALAGSVVALVDRGAVSQFFTHPALWLIAMASGITNAAFNSAVAFGDVVRVVLLFYLMPIWALVFARLFLHEAITRVAVLRIAVGLAGAMIVLYSPASGLPIPTSAVDWFSVLGGAAFALNNVMLRRHAALPREGRIFAMFAGGVLMAGCAAGVALLAGKLSLPPSGMWTQTAVLPLLLFWTAAFLAGNMALQYGATRLPASLTAVIMLFEVVVAAASSWLLDAGTPRWQDALGGLLIIAAPFLFNAAQAPAQAPASH
jgi:drug/metabolite transporter (DMT)-like permease